MTTIRCVASTLTYTLFALLLATPATVAEAAVTAYEAFNYASGSDLHGQSGGGSFGFSDSWDGYGGYLLASGSLTSPNPSPATSGNRISADAYHANRQMQRPLSQPLGVDNTTAYISYYIQAEDTLGGGAFDGWFGYVMRGTGDHIYAGGGGTNFIFGVSGGSGGSALSSTPVVSGEPHWIVLRADFHAGADEFRLYIDPDINQAEPLTPDAYLNTVNMGIATEIGLTGPGAIGFDELRIGQTWGDISTVPEPSTLTLLALAAVSLYCCHRRRFVDGLKLRRQESNLRHCD